ncbi:MAG: adenylate/guanylate cyclase domain-containing protein [Reyranella sp.]|uniref:adenylate/guanylate cyclase domain-containing protein n=1 Tax=Reyranella sp. TaxID=1929291 RepID=UPI0011FEE812|nr:adenylate/guanylate cyclase domain-containing protein [Reyranella sp.]TAJ87891.1 MAG: adenylate/guanylate cyclase domain-containing protein [Reyranella sp.]TBR26825.1 MAG: adenylate/guanylate cyclase domain-containing protein [Reyranella sp.]
MVSSGLAEFVRGLRVRRAAEWRASSENPFLLEALRKEKLEGQRIAAWARTVALAATGVLIAFQNANWSMLYFHGLLLVFIALGWAQLRFATVGRSRIELLLILADLVLLAVTLTVPNPFVAERFPTAMVFRFETFPYFFIILALATLAYSWRTILSIGSVVVVIWLVSVLGVALFGTTDPELGARVAAAFGDVPVLRGIVDPNSVVWSIRAQEMVIFFLVAAILALRGQRSNALLIRQADLAAERASLSRYFPPSMVDELATASSDVGAVRSQDVAVLFADIVGFTKLAERETPETVVELLRRCHAVIEQAIFANGGTLDKYLGDGVMATFGTPRISPADCANALAAARDIVEGVASANTGLVAAGLPPLQISVGVHFGPAILGNIGSERRLEFATLGDTVNVASRLESATRALGCRIVASDALVSRVGEGTQGAVTGGFRRVPALSLRGREAPIDVWVA